MQETSPIEKVLFWASPKSLMNWLKDYQEEDEHIALEKTLNWLKDYQKEYEHIALEKALNSSKVYTK